MKDKLYVGLAYSALDIPEYEGIMSKQWSDLNGHKCLGSFLLEKVEEKRIFKKPEVKGFVEYRTRQSVSGTNNQFHRFDDLPLASECNEEFLSWFIAPLSSTDNMINVKEYMALPLEKIYNSLKAVKYVFEAGAKKHEIELTQDEIKYMK